MSSTKETGQLPTLDEIDYRDDDAQAGRRIKPRGKRKKPFGIECRYPRRKNFLSNLNFWNKWWVYNRYTTEARRDHALAALTRKDKGSILHAEYRKIDF